MPLPHLSPTTEAGTARRSSTCYLRHFQLRRRRQQSLCHRHQLRRHDDERPCRCIPRSLQSRLSLLRCACWMFLRRRSNCRPSNTRMEQSMCPGPGLKDCSGMGRPDSQLLPRLHRCSAQDDGVSLSLQLSRCFVTKEYADGMAQLIKFCIMPNMPRSCCSGPTC